jgi:hypothetical protein
MPEDGVYRKLILLYRVSDDFRFSWPTKG